MVTKGYTEARAHFADILDHLIENREPVMITRRGSAPIALIPAGELDSLLETMHLLRSRTNAERLLASLAHARARFGSPTSLEDLKTELGLDDA